MPPPKLQLIGVDKTPIFTNTLPGVGFQPIGESLPVVMAIGVTPVQKYVPIPLFDGTSDASVAASIITVVVLNPNRRYLKILNNGPGDVELWTGVAPAKSVVGQAIPQGELLFKKGGGLAELGERISIIFATSSQVASGLVVLEG